MVQNDLVIGVIASLVTALGVLGLVIKSFISGEKKTSCSCQPRDCYEQNQAILSHLDALSKDISLVQKTLDQRQTLFHQIRDELDDIGKRDS